MLTDIRTLADPFLCALTNINTHQTEEVGRGMEWEGGELRGEGGTAEIGRAGSPYLSNELLSHSKRHLPEDEDGNLELLVRELSK
jgi:hypothetical protein